MRLGELPVGSDVMFKSVDQVYTVLPSEGYSIRLRFQGPDTDETVSNASAPAYCEMASDEAAFVGCLNKDQYSGWIVRLGPKSNPVVDRSLVLPGGPMEWDG